MGNSEDLPNLNASHLSAGLQWLELMSAEGKWNLRHEEKLKLLGNISDSELDVLYLLNECDPLNEFERSVMERLALLVLIAKNSAALVGVEFYCELFNRKNSNQIFNNHSIKSYLLGSESVEDLYVVVRYLENSVR